MSLRDRLKDAEKEQREFGGKDVQTAVKVFKTLLIVAGVVKAIVAAVTGGEISKGVEAAKEAAASGRDALKDLGKQLA